MKKKIIFGTALFIAVGLFMFTFANPNDKVSDDKSSKQTVKEVSNEEATKEEQKTQEPEKNEQKANTSTNTRRISRRNTTTTPVVNPVLPQTPVQEAVNNEEAAKKEAEEKAKQEAEEKAKQEAADLLAYKDAAKEELDNYKKDVDYSDKNKDAVADIKTDGKDAIDDAKTKEEVDKALKDAKDLIDALDTIAPVITVAADEEVYQTAKDSFANLNNYTVTDNVSATDKIQVKISVTKDGKKINKNIVNYKEPGTYVVSYTAIDEAGNKATATRNIKVLEVKAVSLVLKSGNEDVTNTTDTYIAGDKAKDINVYVKYNDGTTKRLYTQVCYGFFPFITCTDGYAANGYIDTSVAFNGTKTITYSYKGLKSVTYSYKVNPVQVVSLEIIANKTTYIQGQNFDIVVNAIYNNGKVDKKVRYITNANTNTVGKDQKAVISYKGATATYTYDVIARSVVKLQVTNNNKTAYIEGQPLNLTVTATWNDGKVEKITNYTTTANTNTVGYNQEGIVTYNGATASFRFNVIARKVTSLEVIANKTVYTKGEDFDIIVNATWNDGTKEEKVAYTTTANTNTVGKDQKATIKYAGAKATFKYDVITNITLKVTSPSNDYIKGDKIDNITVYANGKPVTGYTIAGDTSKVGYGQTATISYEGATVTYTYNVKYELLIVKHGYSFYLEFAENVNVASIVYYNKKGNANIIYKNDGRYSNKYGNKYYLKENQHSDIHSMNGKDADQKLVITLTDGSVYTYTQVIISN